jgi:hypothetical protein
MWCCWPAQIGPHPDTHEVDGMSRFIDGTNKSSSSQRVLVASRHQVLDKDLEWLLNLMVIFYSILFDTNTMDVNKRADLYCYRLQNRVHS